MKILGISCSPQKRGNTSTLLEKALSGAAQEGAETEVFSLAGKEINGCKGCYSCHKTGECITKDDMQTLKEKMIEAQGILFGVPVYFYGMNAQAKAIIDRTFSFITPETSLRNKVGGLVTVAGSIGLIDVVKDFYFFFALKQMLPANFVAAYATSKGDIDNRELGLAAAFDLGRQMVQLVDKKFEYPKGFNTNFFAFGTHTH